jgi:oligopeptide transport system ATP-binding protein
LNFEPNLDAAARNARVSQMLARVGLLPEHINRYPHEFSGGQCQRIGIARAMILNPKLIVCDEPVSALDVSVQGQILNLLRDLQSDYGLSLIFISHNLAVVFRLCHRVMVLYLGQVMEEGPTEALINHPRHPYTKALIAAVPSPDPALERDRKHEAVRGEPPSPLDPPSGCVFRTRCPRAFDRCAKEIPKARTVGALGHQVACHLEDDGQGG